MSMWFAVAAALVMIMSVGLVLAYAIKKHG